MTRTLPLISAGALGPILDWMAVNDRRAAERLAARDLSWIAGHPPERPVPLLPAVALLVDLSRAHGPDLPSRVAQSRGIFNIGPLGARALGAGTVGGALGAIAAAMPHHCTHEIVTVEASAGTFVIRDLWSLTFDDQETVHAVQQYVAAVLVSLFRLASGPEAPQVVIAIRPHPEAGTGHLSPWLGDAVAPSASGTLAISVPYALAERKLDVNGLASATAPAADWPRLRTDDTLAGSIRHLVRSMLGFDTPTVDLVARYARMSRRSFQRQLSHEGTSLSAILDEERRHLAINRAGHGDEALATLSSHLGYAGQASLSRAFRRWTGAPPSRFGRP